MSGPSVPPKVTVSFAKEEETIAIVSLLSEPANAMDLQFWTELHSALVHIESNPKTRVLIFLSKLKRDIFTAGNDIKELYAPETTAKRYEKFWRVQTTFLTRLLVSPLVTIAGIRGACPAGGAMLSLCCDYRVQTTHKTSSFGLNEVMLGIPVPKFWALRFCEVTLSKALGEKLLLQGALAKPSEALRYGLIDEVCEEGMLEKRVMEIAEKMKRLPRDGYAKTKINLRGAFAEEWYRYGCEEEAKDGFRMLCEPTIVKQLKRVLDGLRGGGGGGGQKASSKL
jgi:3,2-trans-enoyl-CoA isomerase